MDYRKGEGITYFDHPQNPGFPSKWHVREDGWMGASVCRDEARVIPKNEPLVLRYLLWMSDAGDGDPAVVAREFAERAPLVLSRSRRPHTAYEILRAER